MYLIIMKPNFNTNKFYPCIACSLSKIACNKQANRQIMTIGPYYM